MPTELEIREHTTPRWPLVRFTDEELAEDDPDGAMDIAPMALTDGELVALKVLLVSWTNMHRGRDDLTREEQWACRAASSSLAKISLALASFLPKGEGPA